MKIFGGHHVDMPKLCEMLHEFEGPNISGEYKEFNDLLQVLRNSCIQIVYQNIQNIW